MKKILYLILPVFMLATMFASAESASLGTFQQYKCIQLLQTCSNCTYNNISSVIYPNGSQVIGQSVMTKNGLAYNYSNFCKTSLLGDYTVNGFGDLNGQNEVWSYTFLITPSGSTNILGLFIIVILVIYGIAFIGFFGKNEYIAMIGGMAMIILGLYMITSGIDIYRNTMTNALAWTTIGLGALFALTSGVHMITETYN